MLDTIRKLPVISSLSLAFGVAAGLSAVTGSETFAMPLAMVALASPFISGGLIVGSALDMADKTRSKLSKIFSGVAIASAISGIAAFAAYAGASGFEPLVGIFGSAVGMSVAGGFNLVAHATRNKHLSVTVNADISDTKPQQPAPKP